MQWLWVKEWVHYLNKRFIIKYRLMSTQSPKWFKDYIKDCQGTGQAYKYKSTRADMLVWRRLEGLKARNRDWMISYLLNAVMHHSVWKCKWVRLLWLVWLPSKPNHCHCTFLSPYSHSPTISLLICSEKFSIKKGHLSIYNCLYNTELRGNLDQCTYTQIPI